MNIIRKTLLVLILANTRLSKTRKANNVLDYDKTKEIIQTCLNEILNLLRINEKITRNPKVRLLLIIHHNLNSVVKHKWIQHNIVQNISAASYIGVPQKVYEFVDEAITAVTGNNKTINTSHINISVENKSRDFLTDLLNQINELSIPKEESYELCVGKPPDEDDENQRRSNDDIQTWQPDDFPMDNRRSEGGRPVTVAQYPFIASVHVLGKFSCSGSVVSTVFVITAASCLQPGTIYKAHQKPIQVRIGSEYTDIGGEMLPALEVIFHPGFDPVTLANNLALIKLKNIQHPFRRPAIKKIRIDSLPNSLPKDVVAKGVFILGWGDGVDVRKKNVQRLTAAFLQLQSVDECIDVYTGQYVTDKNFCAGLVYKGVGTCNGDIGGPAIVLGTLVGIVSFGPPTCGTVSDPTVFTKVGYYSAWINDVIDEKIPKAALSDLYWQSEQAVLAADIPVLRNSNEEMLILRKLVHELDKPENLLADAIEKDLDIEDEMKIIFQNTTKLDAAQHTLINKSIVFVPGLHIPTETTTATMVNAKTTALFHDVGLPDGIPYDIINDLIPDSTELRYIVHQYLINGTSFKSHKHNIDKETQKSSLETNENFEYESSEGMSIEMPPERNLNENLDIEILRNVADDKKTVQKDNTVVETGKKIRDKITVFDLGNHEHNFNIGGSNIHSHVASKDVWLEVKRLKDMQKKRGFTPISKLMLRAPKNAMASRIKSLYLAQLAHKLKRIRESENI